MKTLKEKEKTLPYWVRNKELPSTKYLRSEDVKDAITQIRNKFCNAYRSGELSYSDIDLYIEQIVGEDFIE